MLKLIMIDTPKKVPTCSKCNGKVEWFGMFSTHDMLSEYANGYCSKCGHLEEGNKEQVYGKITEVSFAELKKIIGKSK